MTRLRIIKSLVPLTVIAAILISPWFAIYPIIYIAFVASLNVQNKWGRFVRRIMWWAVIKQLFIDQIKELPFAYPVIIMIELGGREHYIEKGHDQFIDYIVEPGKPFKKEQLPDKDIYFDKYLAQERPDLVMNRYKDLDEALNNPKNYDEKGNYIHPLN